MRAAKSESARAKWSCGEGLVKKHRSYVYSARRHWQFFFFTQGMRPDQGIPKVVVLLTDGYSNGRAVAFPANQLRNLGVNIFSIGVGSNVNPAELNVIATDPDSTHVFRMSSFNDLAGWVDKLSAVSCDGEWYYLDVDHNPF